MILKNTKKHSLQLLILIYAVIVGSTCKAQLPTNNPKAPKVLLPNGWSLSPAGRSLPLGDLPLNMVLSHDKQMLAVTNNGQSEQVIQLIDPKNEKLLDEVSIAKSWYGIRFSDDDKKLYVSGGNDNIILAYAIAGRKIGKADTLTLGKPWPVKISPAGLDINNKTNRLYTVTKEDSALYVFDLKTKAVVKKIDLQHEAYSCLLSPNKLKLYISLWGGAKLLVYNTVTGKIGSEIPTGNHPNEIVCSKNGKYVYVANANDNSVSVISTATNKVIETISATLYPTKLTGSTTNGLALSADEKLLYIANADNNCLAVFNVSVPGKSVSKGFIPTGWYPTNVKTYGSKILVANGKGFASMANPQGPQPIKKTDNSGYQTGITDKKKVQYIGGLFKGTLSIIDQPSEARLNTYSKQVYANTPFSLQVEKEAKGEDGNPIPMKKGDVSPIKHVFYIIKENRTYDQVLGDMKEGNGDTSLCIFPERVTPNHHALARQFVLLDNFYVDAEVSADGHNWSMAAYATDYVEKTWPISYGGRGGTYDYEGSRKIAFPKDGFIWDYCKRAGLSYRTYGEFGENGKANIKALEGRVCPGYDGFDLDIKDVDRVKVFKHDFDSLMAINQVPQFSSIRIGNDHTSGQKIGKISPIAALADNDLALGQLIEYISKSSIWNETAIFVLEDDAQNGPDHIDAHRSPAFVISPYVKMGSVNHTMYSTSGILRTMELILGLPPMSQYDAAALPLFNCFSSKPDLKPYSSLGSNIDLNLRNIAVNTSSKRSESFNFAKEDAAPDLDLNEVVWKSVKGEDSVMPAPRRSAFVKLELKSDDDED
ncbi:bifunctional YncE family protein/alkaline phosphatase family protein [Arcticibacter svalbardensis]|uniref:bifunctional YncE family protein/alkaline phosphatase family protein n=1 Tax=Arcticibacter svalbardensis TaxID=1288027 RepID=UPI00069109DB|nr:bifunctional YncE family protein/alkaline phosphatase family protein [Arcticibacter svalbardensis]